MCGPPRIRIPTPAAAAAVAGAVAVAAVAAAAAAATAVAEMIQCATPTQWAAGQPSVWVRATAVAALAKAGGLSLSEAVWWLDGHRRPKPRAL